MRSGWEPAPPHASPHTAVHARKRASSTALGTQATLPAHHQHLSLARSTPCTASYLAANHSSALAPASVTQSTPLTVQLSSLRQGDTSRVLHMNYQSMSGRLLFLLLSSPGVLGFCLYTPDANGHVTVPDGVERLEDYAFYECTSLVSITLPDSLTSLGDGAFEACTSLASATLPDGLTSISEAAFYGCTALASVRLPDGLTSIGSQAFFFCTSLASVTLPDGLTSLGYGAFQYCTSLALVYVPTGCAVSLLAFEGTAGGYADATHRPPQNLLGHKQHRGTFKQHRRHLWQTGAELSD